MNKIKKNMLKGSAFFALLALFVSCTPEGSGTAQTSEYGANGILKYVNQKYAKGTTHSTKADQTKWKMTNCHDPKLFQDDDGTYYVYATDASCGNIGKVGIHIRYSKDLVNWTGVETSALAGNWDEDFLAWEGFKASSSETLQSDSSNTAYTWAPTVMKQNGLYYMYHGVNADVAVSSGTKWASSIVLAIASNAKGPFYPASYISGYAGNNSDVKKIKSKLEELGVTYSQNFLVRYSAVGSNERTSKSSLDGNEIDNPDYTDSNNARFGCIDPEFVYDVVTGDIKTYTIGTNECYALIYGSWLYGIGLCYVDSVSLKPVAASSFTLNAVSYAAGDELDMSLDQANVSQSSGSYGLLGTRIAGGYGAGYEGAQLFYNSSTNYYYLIASCGGLDYEYRCTLGRSSSIEGPYLDAGGQNMVLTNTEADTNYSANYHAIGSKIIGSHVLDGEYSFRCQGGLSIWRNKDGQILFANHTRTNFQAGYYFYLQIHQMFFNEDGWPVLNQNEFYPDYEGLTSDGKESLSALTLADIAGEYKTILTVRGTETDSVSNLGIYGAESVTSTVNKADAVPTESKTMAIDSSGNITGSNYTGTVALASDGYSATIELKDETGSSLGTFKGIFMHAVDWAKKGGSSVSRRTITFSTICSNTGDSQAGEYFWGNKN
ncbi:family 43 glycosylhydrolase [Treponema sp.]|uniref:family 43 glycosylhydrolase n=1 Tax=Treponema sp. TaxID=166 RepID=UPI003891178F